MAQQHTTAAGSGFDSRSEHIYPILYLENAQALAQIDAMWKSATRRSKYRTTPTNIALRRAMNALDSVADKHLKSAVADGKLLMCWPDSKVVTIGQEGGAA